MPQRIKSLVEDNGEKCVQQFRGSIGGKFNPVTHNHTTNSFQSKRYLCTRPTLIILGDAWIVNRGVWEITGLEGEEIYGVTNVEIETAKHVPHYNL